MAAASSVSGQSPTPIPYRNGLYAGPYDPNRTLPPPPTPKPAANPLGAVANPGTGGYGPSQMPSYQGAFQSALDSARGNIAQQLSGALGDIANSQQRAGEALGQYAPMVNNAYGESQAQLNNAAKTSTSALAKYGVGGQLAEANLAPERAAVAATHQSDLADQGLLATGVAQQAEHERALAQLAAQDRYGQLDQLSAQLAGQVQMAGLSNNQALQMAYLQQQFGNQNALRDFGFQQQLAAGQAQTNTNPASGPYATQGLTQGQVNTVHTDPTYARFTRFIQGGSADPGMIQRYLADRPDMLAVLIAENPSFFGSAQKK